MVQKSLYQIPFTQTGDGNRLPLEQYDLSVLTPAYIVEIDKITSMAFELALVNTVF